MHSRVIIATLFVAACISSTPARAAERLPADPHYNSDNNHQRQIRNTRDQFIRPTTLFQRLLNQSSLQDYLFSNPKLLKIQDIFWHLWEQQTRDRHHKISKQRRVHSIKVE